MRILLVDDNPEILELTAQFLQNNGAVCHTAQHGGQMWPLLNNNEIDIIIMDIMMPGEDGLSLARQIRQTSQIPIIFLSAKNEEIDRILAIELGGDDYITKPFSARELLARIRAILRRTHSDRPKQNPIYEFQKWRLESNHRILTNPHGTIISLSSGEYRLLLIFLENPGKIITRDELLDALKGRDAMLFDRTIDNLVVRLRKKIERDNKNPELIMTEWGRGYIFTPRVHIL